ncbi:MAG: hypothetical protein AAGM22_05135 [Acidobacteriota bacterium]
MNGAIALGLWLLTWSPNHHDLADRIASADALEGQLVPWSAIMEPAWPLWFAWHERPVFGPAVFIPAGDWESGQALLLAGTDRLLPHLFVPRVLLAPGHYRNRNGRLKNLEGLEPDSTERLLHALIGASLEMRLEKDRDFAREFRRRATQTMRDVPPAQQSGAYGGALVDFGAHILSMSHEIGRHQRRRLGRGETLCAVLDHPASLFGLWKRALESGEYVGYKRSPTASGSAIRRGLGGGGWVRTEARLSRADKDWLLASLGVEWTGEPSTDFRFLCETEEGAG